MLVGLFLIVVGVGLLLAFASAGGGRALAPAAPTMVRLQGDGGFDFEIAGESHYQEAISRVCGGPCEEGHQFRTSAVLTPEPSNPHDPHAVAVFVQGEKVGYVSRDDLDEYHEALAALGCAGRPACCDALIVGGWERRRRGGVDRGYFGVRLDLDWPLTGQ